MKRVEAIRTNQTYLLCYKKNEKWEQDRIFCRHDMDHFLDVARIAYIQNLEQNLGLNKEVIYATALLHDIGRFQQYEDGTPHDVASAQIAKEILNELPEKLSFSDEEQEEILQAILAHRNQQFLKKSPKIMEGTLQTLLYQSDKISRKCYICPVEDKCNWKSNKKNKTIKI